MGITVSRKAFDEMVKKYSAELAGVANKDAMNKCEDDLLQAIENGVQGEYPQGQIDNLLKMVQTSTKQTDFANKLMDHPKIFSTGAIQNARQMRFYNITAQYVREIKKNPMDLLQVSELEKNLPHIIKTAIGAGLNPRDALVQQFYDATLEHRPSFIKQLITDPNITSIGDIQSIRFAKLQDEIPMPLTFSFALKSTTEEVSRISGTLKKSIDSKLVDELLQYPGVVATLAESRKQPDYAMLMDIRDPARVKASNESKVALEDFKKKVTSCMNGVKAPLTLEKKAELDKLEAEIKDVAMVIKQKINPHLFDETTKKSALAAVRDIVESGVVVASPKEPGTYLKPSGPSLSGTNAQGR